MAGKFTILVALAVLGHSATRAGNDYQCYREKGPAGLQEVLSQYDHVKSELDTARTLDQSKALSEELERLQTEVDLTAGQRHATVSRLFWFTNLDEAKAAAKESGKPILSLRMLGNLTDEFSCANSRFFRTTLYSNKEISDYLRDNFVLHWQSIRPVPKVTIDFGDGRKLERTITGNSAHYVLTADGQPLDVLPGLYSPQEFLAWLNRTHTLAANYTAATDDGARALVLADYHRERLLTIDSAGFHFEKVALDAPSAQLITREFPTAGQAAGRAAAKSAAENPIVQLLERFRESVAEDMEQNERQLHRKVHEWYAAGQVTADFDALNERVYAELFLTPSSDPWLGLVPQDAYTALDGGGLTVDIPAAAIP